MPRLADFKGIHHGEAIVVCGLGNSIRSLRDPQRFRTIGVNDIERAFTPTYMFCMDAPHTFTPERLQYIQGSQAQFVFTDHDLGISGPHIVRFPIRRAESPRLDDPDVLYLTGRPVTSPFMALCLAAHMGAKAIGLIGVDFTNGHFFAPDGQHRLANQLAGIDRRFYALGSELLERGVKIFNLSVESRLRAFPRLTPEEFWDLQQSGRTHSWTRPVKRVYFFSSRQVQPNAARLSRLINTRTSICCRLSAPGSPDIVPGSMPDIEQSVADASTVELDCETAPLPRAPPAPHEFSDIWRRQVRPLLFGCTAGAPRNGAARPLTVSAIVSQERSTSEELRETVATLAADLSTADEIVVVSSGGTSEPQADWACGSVPLRGIERWPGESFVAARNRASMGCSGDVLLFTDANVQAPECWCAPLLDVFTHENTAAAGPMTSDMYRREVAMCGMMFADPELNTIALPKRQETPYPVPLLPASFLAIRREVFQQVGGWDGGMRQSGAEDLELCLRLWTCGFQCFVVPQLSVAWMNPFAAGALRPRDYWQDLLHNLLRLAIVHFSPERLGAFLACVSAYPEYRAPAAALLGAELTHRQSQVRMSRRHSDDWFFDSFSG